MHKSNLIKSIGWVGLCSLLTAVNSACAGPAISTNKHVEVAAVSPLASPVSPAPVSQVPSALERVGDVPGQERGSYSALQFISEREGWLASGERLWRTLDGGASWELLYSAPTRTDSIAQVEFISPRLGWALLSGKIHKTEDGGATWSQLTQPFPDFPTVSFKFLGDGRRGWAAGGAFILPPAPVRNLPNSYVHPDGKRILHGAIYHTNDGGQSWARQPVPAEVGLIGGLYILDAEHGWALSGTGVLRLDNGVWVRTAFSDLRCGAHNLLRGGTADTANNTPSADFIYFTGPKVGWLGFTDGSLAKSSDGERNWCNVSNPARGASPSQNTETFLYKIYFSDPRTGWGLDSDGELYATKDGGGKWERIDTELIFKNMYFLDATHGWAVAKEGLFRIK